MVKKYSTALTLFLILFAKTGAVAQNFPLEITYAPNEHILYTGNRADQGLYDETQFHTIEFLFAQPNYWTLLANNYATRSNIAANMVFDGDTIFNVGVHFKGNTSYTMIGNSQKKSFGVDMNYLVPGQDLMGYKTLNLNNCFEDASFMREFLYGHQIRKHIPAVKGAYIHLLINGQNWGVYPNIEQVNKNMMGDWYHNNNGTMWRADKPPGQPGGGGPPGWGDGTAALNDLGPDTTTYKAYYTLKNTDETNPWDDLVATCDQLNGIPIANLHTALAPYIDLDRTLWYLASENAFSDDDSYIYKGKMDYYLFWDEESGRMELQEFDGNSVMKNNAVSWSPFYHANDVNYPLLNRLFQNTHLRQRYLAHLRTVINDELNTVQFNALVDHFDTLISASVQADPKKIYTFAQYGTEKTTIKNFVNTRRNNLLGNTEVAQVSPVIAAASMSSNAGVWENPIENEAANVIATCTSPSGIASVTLYYSPELNGIFMETPMLDDGAHNDGAAGDDVYGGQIPGYPAGTAMRFYVQAQSGNVAGTLAFMPPGAEHNVYFYQVDAAWANVLPVVINEAMPSNTMTASDEMGEFEDWIELFNPGANPIDLSHYYLTDNPLNVDKWEIPDGTILNPQEYLIVWCDEDSAQGPLHANFKLSAAGETVLLLNPALELVDTVTWANAVADQGYARVPNGTGPFIYQAPTFSADNSPVGIQTPDADKPNLSIYPNPAAAYVTVVTVAPTDGQWLSLENVMGQTVWRAPAQMYQTVLVGELPAGMYIVRMGLSAERIVVSH